MPSDASAAKVAPVTYGLYVFASALASTLGGNAGMLSLPSMLRRPRPADEEPAGSLPRSPAWIAAGAVASLLFIFVLGRGVTWNP